MRNIEKEVIRNKVIRIIKPYCINTPELTDKLSADCGIDSLDAMGISVDLEREFNLPLTSDDALDVRWCDATVSDLTEDIINRVEQINKGL